MWSAIALAFGLAMDATAVSAARGLTGRRSELAVLPVLFGGFQAGMAALGWLAGRWAGAYIARWDHWIAFVLLTGIGGKMLRDGWREGRRGRGDGAPPTAKREHSIVVYIALALATSIDAAAAGLTLPLVPVAPWIALALIGGVTAACSAAGFTAGRFAGERLGARLTMLGGVVLIAIAVELLVQHLGSAAPTM
jgi:putative Mn2+ efflux pump MntP